MVNPDYAASGNQYRETGNRVEVQRALDAARRLYPTESISCASYRPQEGPERPYRKPDAGGTGKYGICDSGGSALGSGCGGRIVNCSPQ